MSQPVIFTFGAVGDQSDQSDHCESASRNSCPQSPSSRSFNQFSQPSPEAQPSSDKDVVSRRDQNSIGTSQQQNCNQHCSDEDVYRENTLENMESLSAFWSRHRDQAPTHHLVHDFKMEWMWHEIEEQSRKGFIPSPAVQGNHALQDYEMQLMLLEQQNNKRRLMISRSNQKSIPSPLPVQGHHKSLQDYQMQLMLLEQQNKKRLMIARNKLDSMISPVPLSIQQIKQISAVANGRLHQEYGSMETDVEPPVYPRAMRWPDPKVNHKKIRQSKTSLARKTSESFPQFPRLSAELRVKIWTYASLVPRIVELYISLSHQGAITSPAKPPAVLHVCRESRYEALKYYQPSFNGLSVKKPFRYSPCIPRSTPSWKSRGTEYGISSIQTIYFNPSVDTLYVGEATWGDDLATFLTSLPPSEASKIEALAIPLRLAQGSYLTCIDELPALRELIYVTPVPHQYCILLRYRDLWFENVRAKFPLSEGSPDSESHSSCTKRDERYLKGGLAERVWRKKAWLSNREQGRQMGGAGGVGSKGNFAETFCMRLVGGRSKKTNFQAVSDEDAWMPPGNCVYCKAHREGKVSALRSVL